MKAALGQDAYSIDYAEHVKAGLHAKDDKVTGDGVQESVNSGQPR